MIVLVVHIGGVPFKKPESDTPIPAHSHCPLPFTISRKRVQHQPGEERVTLQDAQRTKLTGATTDGPQACRGASGLSERLGMNP